MGTARGAFRYDTTGEWLKGNTHIHSTASDGGKTPVELAAMYARAGYDFLFRTDHWRGSDVATESGKRKLMWIDGIELDGTDQTGAYYHVVGLGRTQGLIRELGFMNALLEARRQGALLVLAHPHWTGNSLEDAQRWDFDGVEVYNHVCRWLNGKSCGAVHWTAMLARNPGTLAFASDDAHLRPEHPGWNGAWVMVNVRERTPAGVLDAIRRGNFFASCGPSFKSIEWDGSRVVARTTPVKFARLVGPASEGARIGSFTRKRLAEAAFTIPDHWSYAYLEIEDERGCRAWSQPLFLPAGSTRPGN